MHVLLSRLSATTRGQVKDTPGDDVMVNQDGGRGLLPQEEDGRVQHHRAGVLLIQFNHFKNDLRFSEGSSMGHRLVKRYSLITEIKIPIREPLY